jgi:N-acetylglucosamine-6-sulfatase
VVRLRRPTTYDYFAYCLNENGRLVSYGQTPWVATACPGAEQRPRTYQSDLYRRKAVDFINRRAPSDQPFFLSVAYLAPHGGRPHDADRRCRGSAKPAPRHRLRYADARLPRPPGFNERDVSDKPAQIRLLPRLDARRINQITLDYQCRRESLLAVDEGVGAMLDALHAHGELEAPWSSSPRTTASSKASTG